MIVLGFALLGTCLCWGADWPQFRGPGRDGKSPETGLLKKWPESGPKELWSVEGLGIGFSSAAVADGYVYTTGMVGEDKQGICFAFDLNGHMKWIASYGPEWKGSHEGVRTTPTVDGDRVYVFSGYGNLVCFDAKTGEEKWAVDTLEKFQGQNLKWGLSESVLIYDDKVICTPGGKDATLVALNKMDGETIWTTKGLSEKAAYCSPVVVELSGKRLIATNIQESIVLIDPDNGNTVYRVYHKKRHDLAAVSPVVTGRYLYVTTGYTRDDSSKPEDFPDRGRMFELTPDGSKYELRWTERKLDCHHGGVMLIDGNVHGTSSAIYPPASKEEVKGMWYCLELPAGQIKYEAKLVGKGSVIYVDDMLYCYGEGGVVGLVRITPTGYEMVSSFEITKGTDEHWAHPTISNGRLYIRHGNAMMAYDIRGN
jgi:outer membrane protein assembly factor BamB